MVAVVVVSMKKLNKKYEKILKIKNKYKINVEKNLVTVPSNKLRQKWKRKQQQNILLTKKKHKIIKIKKISKKK